MKEISPKIRTPNVSKQRLPGVFYVNFTGAAHYTTTAISQKVINLLKNSNSLLRISVCFS